MPKLKSGEIKNENKKTKKAPPRCCFCLLNLLGTKTQRLPAQAGVFIVPTIVKPKEKCVIE